MHRQAAYLLVLSVVGLVVLGLVMLYSASAFARDAHGDADFFLRHQGQWLGLGVIIAVVASRVDYHLWQKTWWVWIGLAVVLLALCFAPGFKHKMNGAYRWLNLGHGLVFQPSEFGKLAAVCALAAWFGKPERTEREFFRGFILPALPPLLLMGLIAPEVDMGTTLLIGTTTFVLMYVAGTRFLYLFGTFAAGAGVVTFLVLHIIHAPAGPHGPGKVNTAEERKARILAFLHPELYPEKAYQAEQGKIAFGSGGVEGLGLGNGRQKLSFLPEAHTDFIFPTIGEELGLRCTLFVVFAYIVFILCGGIIAIRARDRFGLLFGMGFVVLIALQAAVNIGVTTTLLPNKGLPLPFISYGGSNLVFCLLGVGILLNIYRQGKSDREARETHALEAQARKRRLIRL